MTPASHWETAPFADVIAQWDAMVMRWELEGDECSALLGNGGDGPVDDARSYGVATAECRMRRLVTLEGIVLSVFEGDEDRLRCWLRRPNRNLGHRTPIEVMTRSPEWIRFLIDAIGVAT